MRLKIAGIVCFAFFHSSSFCQQGGSAIQFYDSTGSTKTAKFGWAGNPIDGYFFIETPNDGNGFTAKNGNVNIDGSVTASSFKGNGTEITDLNGQNLIPYSITADKIDSVNWDRISGIPSGFADNVDNVGTDGGVSLPISISDVTGLQASLDGKASSVHSHTVSNISGLQDSLNARQLKNTHLDDLADGSLSGSKVNPDFGSQTIKTAGYLQLNNSQSQRWAIESPTQNHSDLSTAGLWFEKYNSSGGRVLTCAIESFSNGTSGTDNYNHLLQMYGDISAYRPSGISYIKASSGGKQITVSQDGTNATISCDGNLQLSPSGSVISTKNIYVNSNLCCSSDKRFKKNIVPIHGAIDKIKSITGVYFDWDGASFPERHFNTDRQIGVIAQDVEKEIPEVVSKDENGYKYVSYDKLNAVLIQAIKEQQKQIDELTAIVKGLQNNTANNSVGFNY